MELIKNKKEKNFVLIFIALFSLILVSNIVLAPPPSEPHDVRGRVLFYNGSHFLGVENGIPVFINDTTSGTEATTYVYAPSIPSIKGSFSTVIEGITGDTIIARAWNSSHYGQNVTILAATTTTVNIVMNRTRPSETRVRITTPQNHTVKEISYVFNLTANISIIGGSNGVTCYAKINFSDSTILSLFQDTTIHSLGNINLGSSKKTTWNLTGVKNGNSNINVTAYCDSDGINFEGVNSFTIYNITINDTLSPNVTLELPINNSWSNQENISFYYNATDPSGIKSCAIYIDDVLQKTNTTVVSGTLNRFDLYNLDEGNQSWYVSCFDNSSNQNEGNSSLYNVDIDLTYPKTRLISPSNGFTHINNTVIFEYNVTDDYGEISNCSLLFDGSIYDTDDTITKNISQNFTITLNGAYYDWSIQCYDKGGNLNISNSRIVNVTDPDLVVYSTRINFSDEDPVENIQIKINATIYNIGNENATDVIVRFYENTSFCTAQIGTDQIINLSLRTNTTLNVTWNTKIGSYNIYVVVDPPYETNGSITELNEDNNVANKTLFIPAYNIYYGDVQADLMLTTMSNLSVFTWIKFNDINGNVYVADQDSNINWSALYSIGNTIADTYSADDFADIDTALNLTNYTDSINNSYTENNLIKANDSFLIFGRNISNVPVVNSTNTSDFITGILWDSSDSNPGEYTGSQDLIFITKVNQDKGGAYGIYDYEMKVPANLKRYIAPNDGDTVTFYFELI